MRYLAFSGAPTTYGDQGHTVEACSPANGGAMSRTGSRRAKTPAEREAQRAKKRVAKAAKLAAEAAERAAGIARYEAVQRELDEPRAAYPEDTQRRVPAKPVPRPVPGGPRRDSTYGGESLRTVSGGAPSLGRR